MLAYPSRMATSVADTATAAVRDLLARGRYQPGDRLPPERTLADGLGLSRPTLREALRRLTEAGLLESRRGSGTYVAEIDLDAVFAVRLQLEPYAASLAAAKRGSADVQRLSRLAKALPGQIDDAAAFAATDLEIHRTLAEASGNPVLCDLLDRLNELTQLSRAITSVSHDARRATLRDLRLLVRAVRRRDADAAAAAMEAHIDCVREVAAKLEPPDRRIRPALHEATA
jgi:GntR family transcriptional regulator, transcriptional repressor for pyruvate dehydrogenase complex